VRGSNILQTSPTFYCLEFTGVNPAAVAYYEFHPAEFGGLDDNNQPKHTEPRLKLITLDGDAIELQGENASRYFEQFKRSGISVLPLSNKEYAVKTIQSFINSGYRYVTVDNVNEALSVLGA
jgi:hypothetical protein